MEPSEDNERNSDRSVITWSVLKVQNVHGAYKIAVWGLAWQRRKVNILLKYC
jgi:hypothetical protein